MASPLTPEQAAQYSDDRRPALFGSLIALLVLNNLVVIARCFTQYRLHYRQKSWKDRRYGAVFPEDLFLVLGGLCINVVIANLLASTSYGLGLHSWRINAEDPNMPTNLSNTFKHVWITMLFQGPTFTCIKLTLLLFYRRIFLVNQRWLRIAWWANMVYVMLWFVGATGFYLLQCQPVQWYFMRYYQKYHVAPPYPIDGQCNATTTTHVAIPIILGVLSDVAILLLPLAAILKLSLSRKTKVGIAGVFSLGGLACALDIGRIVELTVDTDDSVDPSYGVVIFLILSAATEVAAVTCACLPVIVPQAIKEYKRLRHPSYRSPRRGYSTKLSGSNVSGQSRGHRSRRFELNALSDSPPGTEQHHDDTVHLADAGSEPAISAGHVEGRPIALDSLASNDAKATASPGRVVPAEVPGKGLIRVRRDIEVCYGDSENEPVEMRSPY